MEEFKGLKSIKVSNKKGGRRGGGVFVLLRDTRRRTRRSTDDDVDKTKEGPLNNLRCGKMEREE